MHFGGDLVLHVFCLLPGCLGSPLRGSANQADDSVLILEAHLLMDGCLYIVCTLSLQGDTGGIAEFKDDSSQVSQSQLCW